jgi:Rieske Fe-S protein
MKIKYSLISRRQFLNTLFGGSLIAFFSGTIFSLAKFAFPTLGKEPDFVVLDKKDFTGISKNSAKAFAWGGILGLYLKKEDGSVAALKGVCTHMECNVAYRPAEKNFTAPAIRAGMTRQARILPGRRPNRWSFLKSWKKVKN